MPQGMWDFSSLPVMEPVLPTVEVRSLFFFILFILFSALLGLRCCARGLSLVVVVRRLLIAVASLCCGAWTLGTRASVVVARGL